MQRKLIIMLFLILIIACRKEKSEKGNIQVIKGYTAGILDNASDIKFKSFRLVPLEMTPQSILSDVDRVGLIDSFLIVQDGNQLLCFDRNGKFKWKYGAEGRGPGEYLRINTFFLDKEKKTVNMVDEFLLKIISFDMDGTFLSEKRYTKPALYMTHSAGLTSQGKILRDNYVCNDFNVIFSLLDLASGENIELYRLPVKTQKIAMSVGRQPVSFYKDSVRMLVPFDNKIYTFRENKMVAWKLIDTDKKILSPKQLEAIDNYSIDAYFAYYKENYFLGFKDIIETEDYILLNEMGPNNYFLINKSSQSGRLYKYNVEEEINHLPLLNIIAADSDYWVGYAPYHLLKSVAELIPLKPEDKHLQEFKTIFQTLEEDTNPCLLFYGIL